MEQMSEKHRNYCFTLNNYTDEEYKNILQWGHKYIVIGKEIGENKTPHLQGYVEFENPRSFNALKKKCKRIHLEKRQGTAKQASDYCKKDGDYFEDGKMSNQGERKDLDEVKELIISGKTTVDNLAITDPTVVYKYGRVLDRIEDICMRKKWRTEMTEGIWYYGPTGVGKSHKAYEGFTDETHYNKPKDNQWWDGYRQQPIVIINEFRGDIPLSKLLELVDKYPTTVNRRNREPMPFLSKKVIITSPCPPEEVYANVLTTNDSIAQVYRRFKVIKMTGTEEMEQKWSGGNTNPCPYPFEQNLI